MTPENDRVCIAKALRKRTLDKMNRAHGLGNSFLSSQLAIVFCNAGCQKRSSQAAAQFEEGLNFTLQRTIYGRKR